MMSLKNDPRYIFLRSSVQTMDYLRNYMPINADMFQNYIVDFLDLGIDPDLHEEVIFYSMMNQSKQLLREQLLRILELVDSQIGIGDVTIFADVYRSMFVLIEMAKSGNIDVLDELAARVLQAHELKEYVEIETLVQVMDLYLDGVENLIHGLLQENGELDD